MSQEKIMYVRCYNIKWDGNDVSCLPTTVIFRIEEDFNCDDLADMLSDKYGYCVKKLEFDFIGNRITQAIGVLQEQIFESLLERRTTSKSLNDLHGKLNMSLSEHCRFHELKSMAVLSGLLTLEEANTVYGYLGQCVHTFNEQPLEVKIVLTKLLEELIIDALTHI
jgi:hypothetical protein